MALSRSLVVLEMVGSAYRLDLPPQLVGVHNIFHVSMLKKYGSNPSHVIDYEPVDIQCELSYEEKPLAILEAREKALQNRNVCEINMYRSQHKSNRYKQNFEHLFN